MKYKAVIFDLDGTLLNTIDDLADSVNELLLELGLPLHSADSYKKFVGSGVEMLVSRSLPDEYAAKCDISDLVKRYRAIYKKKITNKTKPYDGISAMLKRLNKLNLPVNVLSNKPDRETKFIVDYFFKDISFKAVQGAIENMPVKPDPSGVFQIAGINKIDRADFIYAGDSDIDMLTAKNAGMFPVGVLWGFRDRDELIESGAGLIISKPDELLDFIQN